MQAEKAHINTKMRTVTAGAVEGFTKLNDMREFVNARGHNMSKVNKRAVTAVLAHDPDDTVREVLELRQASSNTAVEKYNAVLAGAFPDQRIRGLLNYYGTHTGRWTSAGFNAHNLPREDAADALAAIAAIQSGDLEQVRAFGPPLDVIARVARGLVVAPPSKLLLAGDFTTIEPRVASWFAEETWKLDSFRTFDETGDPLLDAHRVVGARMRGRPVDPNDDEARQHGKTVHMAFNYGASVRVWREHVPNDPRSDEEIKAQEVDKFRRLHPAQTQFMYDLDTQALRCVRYREPVQRKRHSFEMDGDTLILRLPSGRPLFYPRAHIKPGRFGKDVVAYHNPANKNREDEMWYGAWLAHLVSSTSRDLLVNALFNLDAAGFDIVLHVHDEIVAEIDPANVERDRERFKACMLQAPAWAEGLPLAAKVRVGPRYIKADAPIEITAPTPIEPVVPVEPSIEIPTEMPRDPPPLETPTPTPPPPRYNGFAHDNFDSEIQVSLRDIVGEPLVHNKVCCPFHDDANAVVPHLPRPLSLLRLRRAWRRHQLVDGGRGPELHCRAGCARLLGATATAGGGARGRRQDAGARAQAVGRGAADRRHPRRGLSHVPAHRRRPAAERRASGAALSPELPVRRRHSAPVPAGAVSGHRHRRLRRHPSHRIDGERVRAWRHGRAPHAGALARAVAPSSCGRRARVLVLGEGVETVLAAAHPSRCTQGHPLRPAWAMASAGALARCGPIPEVDCVCDPGRQRTDRTPRRARLRAALERRGAQGRRADAGRAGEDFNDLVRARAS